MPLSKGRVLFYENPKGHELIVSKHVGEGEIRQGTAVFFLKKG